MYSSSVSSNIMSLSPLVVSRAPLFSLPPPPSHSSYSYTGRKDLLGLLEKKRLQYLLRKHSRRRLQQKLPDKVEIEQEGEQEEGEGVEEDLSKEILTMSSQTSRGEEETVTRTTPQIMDMKDLEPATIAEQVVYKAKVNMKIKKRRRKKTSAAAGTTTSNTGNDKEPQGVITTLNSSSHSPSSKPQTSTTAKLKAIETRHNNKNYTVIKHKKTTNSYIINRPQKITLPCQLTTTAVCNSTAITDHRTPPLITPSTIAAYHACTTSTTKQPNASTLHNTASHCCEEKGITSIITRQSSRDNTRTNTKNDKSNNHEPPHTTNTAPDQYNPSITTNHNSEGIVHNNNDDHHIIAEEKGTTDVLQQFNGDLKVYHGLFYEQVRKEWRDTIKRQKTHQQTVSSSPFCKARRFLVFERKNNDSNRQRDLPTTPSHNQELSMLTYHESGSQNDPHQTTTNCDPSTTRDSLPSNHYQLIHRSNSSSGSGSHQQNLIKRNSTLTFSPDVGQRQTFACHPFQLSTTNKQIITISKAMTKTGMIQDSFEEQRKQEKRKTKQEQTLLKVKQRSEIYALNVLMKELEEQKFQEALKLAEGNNV